MMQAGAPLGCVQHSVTGSLKSNSLGAWGLAQPAARRTAARLARRSAAFDTGALSRRGC